MCVRYGYLCDLRALLNLEGFFLRGWQRGEMKITGEDGVDGGGVEMYVTRAEGTR